MSLTLRFGASINESLWGLIPRLPRIAIRINNNPSSIGHHEHSHDHVQCDERLRELQEQLENGEEPFMIDNGTILRAVPKKKVSYTRKRTKLYAAGRKQIQPLQNIVRCSACGRVKRSHFMCMYCFAEIRQFLKGKKRDAGLLKEEPKVQTDLDPIDERILYPGKRETQYQLRLKEKDWIPRREEAPMYDKAFLVHKKK
ncbi:uncharacterized protein J8A68_000647 [[Candida] subhashii]|uniref:54S ribosomal protein L32, mitochondrial n=1 Tax=[Candida] subhashii TaxID=561895 RepID=A0A8J5UUC4_9ASCO|nr:uncharacterized protein J8A68_000647 [[Candida] subhashii]KAG7665822.1 hypothetical protein J8A68_000647 [[Candida] subhashii]